MALRLKSVAGPPAGPGSGAPSPSLGRAPPAPAARRPAAETGSAGLAHSAAGGVGGG